jgi:hypothetical protein
MIMRSVIFAGALACCSLSVFANQCNVELSGAIQLENQILQVTLDDQTQLTINPDKTLYLDGVVMPLNGQQQIWMDNYYDGINSIVPQAANIATEAVALATTALNQVFTELLGSDSTVLADLSAKLHYIEQQIHTNFYAENGEIRLHSASFKNGEFFGEQWQANFEEVIEELITESMGHIMVAIGTQMIFGGDDMRKFEQKMERFGEQMERRVEYQSAVLENKAEVLCDTLAKVNIAENQLQQNIHQLAKLDVIQFNHSSDLM